MNVGGSITVGDIKEWLPFIANLVVAAVIYGGMWADVRNVKESLRTHNKENDNDFETLRKSDSRQWDRLDEHGQRLTKVETVLEVRSRGIGGSGSGGSL